MIRRGGPRLGLALRNHRQFRGIPSGQAAGHLHQVGDPVLVQDAGCYRRAVAARAMNSDASIARDFPDALLQMVERNIHTAIDVFRGPLTRISDIDQQRGIGAR